MSDPAPGDITDNTSHPAGNSQIPTQIGGTSVHEQANGQNCKHKCQRWLRKIPVWVEMACAVALVIITWTYAYYAKQQWQTMNRTYVEIQKQTTSANDAAGAAKSAATTADNSLKQAFRPRIALNSPRVGITDGKLSLGLQVVNFGTTSARNVVWQRATEIGPIEKLRQPRYELPSGILKTGYPKEIPPNNVTGIGPSDIGFYGGKDLTPQELGALTSESEWAVFSVLVTYDDDFPLTHHAEICVESSGKAGGMRWQYCPWPTRND